MKDLLMHKFCLTVRGNYVKDGMAAKLDGLTTFFYLCMQLIIMMVNW